MPTEGIFIVKASSIAELFNLKYQETNNKLGKVNQTRFKLKLKWLEGDCRTSNFLWEKMRFYTKKLPCCLRFTKIAL